MINVGVTISVYALGHGDVNARDVVNVHRTNAESHCGIFFF